MFFSTDRKSATLQILLVVLTIMIYGRGLGFALLNYDDNFNITGNLHLLSGDWVYFWSHSYVDLFIPVTYSLWLFIYKLFGMSAPAFHTAVILFHIANVLLLFQILKRLIQSDEAAFWGALLFMVHPLNVETVFWATALKDTLVYFFVLGAVLIYFANPKLKFLVIVFMILGILSKPTAGVLPFLFFLLAFSETGGESVFDRLKKSAKKNIWLVLPMLAGLAALLSAKITLSNEVAAIGDISLTEKFITVGDSVGFYLQKVVFPAGLYPDYGRTPRLVLDQKLYFLNIAIAVFFISAVLFALRKMGRNKKEAAAAPITFALLFGLLFYLPVSGIVHFGYQRISSTADRYMYPVLMALGILIGWAGKQALESRFKNRFRLGAVIIFIFFGFLNFMYSQNWKDDLHFFTNMHEGNSRNFYAAHNLAQIYQHQGRSAEALELFIQAHELDPLKMSSVAGIVTVYFNAKRYSDMDSFGLTQLQPEQLKKMNFNAEAAMAIYRSYALAYLDRKKEAQALTFWQAARVMTPTILGSVQGSIA